MAWVYILKCADGSLYVGSTNSISHRLWQHQIGRGSEYTRKRLPVELVWTEEYANVAEAFSREKQIQNWSRAKRLALIENRWDDVVSAGKKRFRRGLDTPPSAALDRLGGLDTPTSAALDRPGS